MRAHLEDIGDLGSPCNWEPLERILALRPLFVRLLCQSPNSGRQREVIGPKCVAQTGDTEQWLKWRIAAQSAVYALGELERHCVAAYLKLCMDRRDGTSWLETQKKSDAMFPVLAGSKIQSRECSRWTSDHSVFVPGQEQFPVLGNPVSIAGHAQSAWVKPLQERRLTKPRSQVSVVPPRNQQGRVPVACSQSSKKSIAEKRAAEKLARIVSARADFESRRVDHWEELA